MTRHRSRVTLVLAALAFAAADATASAHTDVASTTPKRGTTARITITTATVTFTQAIRSGTLQVTGPGGRRVSVGRGARDPRNVKRLRVELAARLRTGRYRATWRMTAADGHDQRGSFSFRLRA